MGGACFVFVLFLKITGVFFLRQKMKKYIYYLNHSKCPITKGTLGSFGI